MENEDKKLHSSTLWKFKRTSKAILNSNLEAIDRPYVPYKDARSANKTNSLINYIWIPYVGKRTLWTVSSEEQPKPKQNYTALT